MALEWTEPILLTRPDPFADSSDEGSLPEADVAWLGGNVAIVGAFSGYSYILRLWAIDVRGAAPVVGPTNYFYGYKNTAWVDPPVPIDPKGAALNDLSFIIPTGPTTFAVIGQANESYDADGTLNRFAGTYCHAATFFEVDPNTLAITRTQMCLVPYAALGSTSWVRSVTGARWGNNVAIVLANGLVLVARPDGTVTVYDLGPINLYLGAPIVVGDEAYFFGDGGAAAHELSVNLNTGELTDGGSVGGVGGGNYSWFGAPRPDGKMIWTTNGTGLFNTYTPVKVAIDVPGDYDPLVLPVADSARTIGWEFDWYGNDRAIGVWPDNTAILAYTPPSGVRTYALVNPDGAVVETGPIANLTLNGLNPQTERMCALDQGRAAAIQVRQVYTTGDITFGVRFTMVPGIEMHIAGQLDRTRVRFL